jgi:putative ABC transport system permease protein
LVVPIIRQGVGVVLTGVVLGTVIALALDRLVASMLYGTTPHDPVVGVAVGMMLVLAALVATAVPAWRASRADPLTALRTD